MVVNVQVPSNLTYFTQSLKHLFKIVYFKANGDKLFRKWNSGYIVLVYHSIPKEGSWYYDIPLKEFEKQVSYLVETFQTCSLLDLIEKPMHENQLNIGLTFDDGYEDNYTNAFDVLKKYDVPATIFITTEFIEEKSNKILHFPDRPSKRMLNWEEIKEMAQSKLIDFGSHCHTHLAVSKVDPEYAMTDMKKSKSILEQNLGKKVDLFAYPGGFYNSETYELLQKIGFKAGYTSVAQINDMNTNSYEIGRVAITQRHRNIPDFVYYLTRTKKGTEL